MTTPCTRVATAAACLLLLVSTPPCAAYNSIASIAQNKLVQVASRRSILGTLLASAAAAATLPANAAASQEEEDVYFGVGCFWHIQHEFVQAERDLLKRSNHQLSSRAGYAGGKQVDKEGRVCYHNFQGAGDYGKMGHGEVVGMTIPTDNIPDFAKVYFDLFNKGERVDPLDKGGEYRSLVGLPGGLNHPQYSAVEAAATAKDMVLVAGKGNDPDTLGKKLVYVYDSNKFPFYQAEVYHQYHNDFQSKAYGKAYNDLADLALEDGRIKGTGCPDRV